MNFIEAGRSGKPFKRDSWPLNDYIVISDTGAFVWESSTEMVDYIFRDWVTSDDWVVREEPPKMKTVYQVAWKDREGRWWISDLLRTEREIEKEYREGTYRLTGFSIEVPDVP